MRSGTFFFPGPTEVRKEVLGAMLRQPIPHRSTEFRELFAGVQRGLRQVFRTVRPVYVATASGTGMMEAAVRCSPGGKLLALVNGAFAERFVTIAQACDRPVDRHDMPIGSVPDLDEVRGLLSSGAYTAISLVHSETSTGALSDIRAIARVAREAGAVVIVDSVSGIGGAEAEFDDWGLDCVLCASQKALALPPGLAFAVTSDEFLRGASGALGRGVYLDLLEYDSHARSDETPTTPCVSLIFALAHQLSAILQEGVEARWARHEAMRLMMESWVASTRDVLDVDIGILARPGVRSPTLTVLTLPAGIDADSLVARVAERGYTIGTGYGTLRATTVRVGHMGDHTVADLAGCLAAIADSLEVLNQRT